MLRKYDLASPREIYEEGIHRLEANIIVAVGVVTHHRGPDYITWPEAIAHAYLVLFRSSHILRSNDSGEVAAHWIFSSSVIGKRR